MFQKVNGIELYYEKMGQGTPIILLHGNGEEHKIFQQLIPKLAESYTVYAIDSRGHGRSTQVKELDYVTMADDIVKFIEALNLKNPILYGFSDGGILGLLLAARYPGLLSKLIISGANTKPDGIRTWYFRSFQLIYLFTRNPKYKLMVTQPNIEDEELANIRIETLVLAGSKDMIQEKHTRHIAECIPGSSLQILEDEDHMSYVYDNEKLYKIIKPFLDKKEEKTRS
ncbi:MAG: alpha/beta hydrolase [Herbinix sp.]|jgi:pimeloyl-ACP methyl ester carboxylesterase|nr:alpha/beta hydrolase [Herbinix sp.]